MRTASSGSSSTPPDRSVNLLSGEILEALDALLREAADRPEVRGLLFTSPKAGMFIAGMDVAQISSVNDSIRGAEAARFGQAVFQNIAAMHAPSVCVIGGTCLGGGTELALACDFRIAADDRSGEDRAARGPARHHSRFWRLPAPAPARRAAEGAGPDPHRGAHSTESVRSVRGSSIRSYRKRTSSVRRFGCSSGRSTTGSSGHRERFAQALGPARHGDRARRAVAAVRARASAQDDVP